MNEQKLKEILDKVQGKSPIDNMAEFLREIFVIFPQLLDYLDANYFSTKENLEEEKDGHPSTPWEILGLRFFFLSKTDPVFLDLSKLIYEHWYQNQIKYELTKSERTIHKGTPVHQLGSIWQEKQDLSKARKYFLLGLIEDTLESLRTQSRDPKNQQGYRVLKSSFYLSESQYKFIHDKVIAAPDKRFPEELLWLCYEGPDRIPTWEEIINEDLDKNYLGSLYQNLQSATNGGSAFEEFAEKLLNSIRGLFVIPGVKQAMSGSKTKEHDYDRIVRNRSSLLSDFGTYSLVECKYWNQEVDYAEIAKFVYKIATRRCKSGILFAKSDVKDNRYNQTIRDAYLAHDSAVIVITEEDIKKILSCKKDLTSLLVDKYEEVRFHL